MTVGQIFTKIYIVISASWFFSKTGKTWVSHRVEMMTRMWKMTQMTHWPGDPVPCLACAICPPDFYTHAYLNNQKNCPRLRTEDSPDSVIIFANPWPIILIFNPRRTTPMSEWRKKFKVKRHAVPKLEWKEIISIKFHHKHFNAHHLLDSTMHDLLTKIQSRNQCFVSFAATFRINRRITLRPRGHDDDTSCPTVAYL